MARVKRLHLISVAIGIALIYFFFSSGSSTTDFRKTTEDGIRRASVRGGPLQGDLSDVDLTAKINKDLENILAKQNSKNREAAKVAAAGKPSPTFTQISDHDLRQGIVKDTDVSVAGRKTMPKAQQSSSKDKAKPKYPLEKGGSTDEDDEVALKGEKVADPGEEVAREELQSILKKSPIIIFSKSYCPYSKRAKNLLLNTYTIIPTPHVVELDLLTEHVPKAHSSSEEDDHPAPTLGAKLQELLATLTGRRTVPNIMINAQSIGGCDDVLALDADGKLEDEIRRLGGRRIVSVEKEDL